MQLRKSFQLVGLDPENIVTLARIGYKLSDSLQISQNGVNSQPISNVNPQNAPSQLSVSAPELTIEENLPSPKIGVSNANFQVISKKMWGNKIMLIIVVFNALLALSGGLFLYYADVNYGDGIAYTVFKSHGGKTYFAQSNSVGGDAHLDSSIAMLKTHPPRYIHLDEYPFIYINGARTKKVFNYFFCERKIEEQENGCVSYLILRSN